jgi:hypothetical protein
MVVRLPWPAGPGMKKAAEEMIFNRLLINWEFLGFIGR